MVLVFALDIPWVKTYFAQQVETQLEQVLGSKVSIEKIDVGLLNAVELHNVALYDRNDELLLSSKMVYAKIRVMPLLKGRIFLRNIAILDADIALYKNAIDGETNYQFIIDIFRPKEKKSRKIDLTINSLLLRRCNLSYDNRYISPATSGVFSPHHLQLHDVEANVSLKELTNDYVALRVRHLQCVDQSGMCLADMHLKLDMDNHEAIVRDVCVKLPHSQLTIPTLKARYNHIPHTSLLSSLTIEDFYPSATISTKDVVAIFPQLKGINDVFCLNCCIGNKNRSLYVKDIYISNEDKTLTANLKSSIDYSVDKNLSIGLNIDKIKIMPEFMARVSQTPSTSNILPILERVGSIEYEGQIEAVTTLPVSKSLFDTKFQTHGIFSTRLGQLSAELSLKKMQLLGKLNSSGLALSDLLQNEKFPSTIDFVVSLKSQLLQTADESLHSLSTRESSIDLSVNRMVLGGNTYSNLHVGVDLHGAQVMLQATADDAALSMQSHITATMPQNSISFNTLKSQKLPTDVVAHIDIAHLSPARLNISNRYKQGIIKFHADASAETLDMDHLNTKLSVTDFSISHDGDNILPYTVQRANLATHCLGDTHQVTLRSDFADLDYVGPLHPQHVREITKNLLSSIRNGQYSDSLNVNRRSYASNQANARMSLFFKDSEILHRMLGINISQRGIIQIQSSVAYDGRDMTFSCLAPELSFGNFRMNGLTLFARNNDGSFNFLAKGEKHIKDGELHAEITAINSEGSIRSTIEWDEINMHKFYGAISASTSILDTGQKRGESINAMKLSTEFSPSQLCIGDSIWQFARSRIDYEAKKLTIEDFGIYNAKQRLSINGAYDRNSEDTIVVSLDNIDLEYALAFAHLGVVDFGGHATGQIFVRQLADGSPWAKASIRVPDFTFNQAPFGIADINLAWNHEKRDIIIQGDINQPSYGYTRVRGYVDPVNRDLDLRTESKNTPLGFLNKYTEGIFSDVNGHATGNCRIYGGFQTIEFSGHEIGNCEATIPVTGVTYRVENADVDIVPDAFIINHATVYDMFNGKGTGYGRLTHKHIKDMCYNFSLEGYNLRMYDKPREIDMPFFATANGTGKVHIYGEPHKMNADIRIATMPGSELTYILDSPDADVSQMLRFHDPLADQKPLIALPKTITTSNSGSASSVPATGSGTSGENIPTTDINLYFEVDVDDQSCLHMITDDKSGDVITVYGSGPIQASYHNKSGFQMYGTYNIDRGTYGLNIPSLAQRRKFDILSGGQVSFSGDPTEAEVNVRAQYVVNSASLADLNIGTGFANNTTRVNCVVNIYGEVANMQFNLDFELPNCSDDEQRMVQNLIASEEDRTMQVLYLLGVGRFYAYNYTTNDLGQSQSMLMMNSLLSSTLSSQINNIISDAIGSNNWSFGTNISTGQLGWNDMEVEGLVSSRLLDNRLILNGNFGYSDRVATTANFVGDFDIQYLITPKGNVLIRAYSETNDRYFTKSTLTTQGIGLQLKHDFTKFINLFRRKKLQQQQ